MSGSSVRGFLTDVCRGASAVFALMILLGLVAVEAGHEFYVGATVGVLLSIAAVAAYWVFLARWVLVDDDR